MAKKKNKTSKNRTTTKTANLKIETKSNVLPIETLVLIFSTVFVLRLLITLIPSYAIDMGGYVAWSKFLAANEFKDLYQTYHVVYAPLYLYCLSITGFLGNLLSFDTVTYELFVKLWAVMSDIVGGYFIFMIGKKFNKEKLGIILGCVYALNPGVFFNSSIWGQFDSIPATLIIGCIYLLSVDRKIWATIVYSAAILTKPQSGLFLPIILILYFKDFKIRDTKHWIKLGYSFLSGIVVYTLTVLPFYIPTTGKDTSGTLFDFYGWVLHLTRLSIDDYPYATANAFNLWTILGGQPITDTDVFFIFSYKVVGIILMFIAMLFLLTYVITNRKEPMVYYFSAYFTMISAFLLFTRMHERYLLPAIIFLTVSILWDKKLIAPLVGLSICVLANHWYLYSLSFKEQFWLVNYDTVAVIFASLTLIVYGYSIYYMFKKIVENKQYLELASFKN